jgi:tRNA pseudouridine13 synthase
MRLKVRAEDFRVEEVLRLPPPDPHGGYAVYRLRKRGLSTFEAVARVASLFGVPPHDVRFAGLKDKRGEAAQFVSVRLGRAATGIPAPRPGAGLSLEPLHRAARPVASEDILANRFRIVVRDLAPDDTAALPARIEAVKKDGLPNYFDDQRLGGASPARGFVAKLLSEGRAEEAVRLAIARPSPKDPRRERLEKKLVAEKWGRWAELSREVQGEAGGIIRRLARAPTDFAGAFRGLDARLRALFVAQYQSWLWNEAAVAAVRAAVARERRFEIMYRGGALVFWRALEEAERAALPAILPLETFPFPRACGVAAKTGARRLILQPAVLEAAAAEPDEAFPGRLAVTLEIELPRGAYATLVAKRLFYEPRP